MRENPQIIRAVQRMQDYIMEHWEAELSLERLAQAARYSPWHALRAFSQLTGKTPMQYLRLVRLTQAAKRLRDGEENVLNVALGTGFTSHEGFLRAFTREFGMTPSEYRKSAPPIEMFTPYRIEDHYAAWRKGRNTMEEIIFASVQTRPARRLILKRGQKATHYFEYCEEVGCDVWGVLLSIKGALDEPIGVWLPEALRKPGTSEYCQGVEMPADYTGPVPEGFDVIDLPECPYLRLQGEPYPEEQYSDAIGRVWRALERYDIAAMGWDWAPEAAPRIQYAPVGERGYIELRPVRRIQ